MLRPLFRSVARTGSPELFVAACLLVILATGLATAAVRLPMELGSLIAGLLLAETEFRRQIEVTIDPFKGLLVGVFLISVGMSLDLGHIVADAPLLLAAGAALVAIKLAADCRPGPRLRPALGAPAARPGCCWARAANSASSSLASAGAEHVIAPGAARFPLLLVAVTMACIPLLSSLGRAIARRTPRPASPATDLALPGRHCRTTPRRASSSPASAAWVKPSPSHAGGARACPMSRWTTIRTGSREVRRTRPSVSWGDLAREEMLHRLHIDIARALVVTMSDHGASDRLVAVARALRPDLLIVVRARDARHAAHLYAHRCHRCGTGNDRSQPAAFRGGAGRSGRADGAGDCHDP